MRYGWWTMKKSHQCPKCQGKRLWQVESFRIPSENVDGAVLAVNCRSKSDDGFLGFPRPAPKGCFDLWVCAGCGFSELWARELEGLEVDPETGVSLHDHSSRAAGPFR